MTRGQREALGAVALNSGTPGLNVGRQITAVPKGRRGKALMKTASASSAFASEKAAFARGKASIRRRTEPPPHLTPSIVHTEPGSLASRDNCAVESIADGSGEQRETETTLQQTSSNRKTQLDRRRHQGPYTEPHHRPQLDLNTWPTGQEQVVRSAPRPRTCRILTYERTDAHKRRAAAAAAASAASPPANTACSPLPKAAGGLAAGGWSSPSKQHVPRPAGIENLGNSCYMNATLQVLLGLSSFISDLEVAAAKVSASGTGGSGGVTAALLKFVREQQAAHSSGSGASPEAIKRCIEGRQSEFLGYLQQDAHEFLTALLDLVHTEVARCDAATQGGATSLPLETTSCPTSRNFSFCIEHQVTCERCGKSTRVTEQYRDLSLELPAETPGACAADVQQLVADHLKDETVEKSCEACGPADSVNHSVRHRFCRLPRILVLHLKRFQAQPSLVGGPLRFSKLHSRVAAPASLELGSLLADAALPPLPNRKPQQYPTTACATASGKENNAASPSLDDSSSGSPLPDAACSPAAQGVKAGDPLEQSQLEAALKQSLATRSPTHDDTHLAGVPGLKGGAVASTAAAVDATPPQAPPDTLSPFPSSKRLRMSSPPPRMQALFDVVSDASWQQEGRRNEAQSPITPHPVHLLSDNDMDDPELQRALQESMATAQSLKKTDLEDKTACESPSSPAVSPGSSRQVPGSPVASVPSPGAMQQPLEVYHMTEPPSPTAADAASSQDAIYELRGVVNHLGLTSKSGHFTAHVKEARSNRWFSHNDTSTTLLQGNSALDTCQRECYILLYEHCQRRDAPEAAIS